MKNHGLADLLCCSLRQNPSMTRCVVDCAPTTFWFSHHNDRSGHRFASAQPPPQRACGAVRRSKERVRGMGHPSVEAQSTTRRSRRGARTHGSSERSQDVGGAGGMNCRRTRRMRAMDLVLPHPACRAARSRCDIVISRKNSADDVRRFHVSRTNGRFASAFNANQIRPCAQVVIEQ